MPRPRADSIKVPTPQRILDAAEAEFAARGFALARLEDIARRAGIRRPAILYHFESKEQLYARTVARAYQEWASAVYEIIGDPGDFEAGLERLVRGFSEYVYQRPSVARLAIQEVLMGDGPGAPIMLAEVLPLLQAATDFVESGCGPVLHSGASTRSAVMQIVGDIMLRAATGPLRTPLWGEDDTLWELARTTLLPATAVEAQSQQR